MHPLLLGIVAFVGVATFVGGLAMLFSKPPASKLEDRLDMFTGLANSPAKDALKDNSVLARPLDDAPNFLAQWFARLGNFDLLFDQADVSLTATKLAAVSLALGMGGGIVAIAMRSPAAVVPIAALAAGALPMLWVIFKRSRRLGAFTAQLPDALEMLARALRAGQSLAFGMNAVASEMPAPIGKEFSRVYEEQNLGVSMEDSLRAMSERVPSLDIHFFVTAVILQRTTGGDLSEILDKIGTLVRNRFRILGTVKALTGEGRLSGVVLLGLPFVLFIVVYNMNPDYVMQLFTDPAGKKMLAVAIVMQLIGAAVIKKIVDIKV